eukprot:590198_1
MALKTDYSSIVSIVYFSINIMFLIALAVLVYNQGGHKIKSKSYFKDVWNQRKIYAPLIIHFYDTATDIGVVYSWYHLMRDKNDYESVDMAVFFWTGVSFLAVYRFCLLCWALIDWLCEGSGEWWHVLLVIVDLYIFVAVYESFMGAQGIVTRNAEKRRKNAERKQKKQASQSVDNSEEEIEPAEKQFLIQLGEAISESMPQIVLQSVFVIRSANDKKLRKGSNIYLIMLSVIASLLSISNKYVYLDKDNVIKTARSLKPRRRVPDCIQYLYLVRIIWRISHVMTRFCVFVLIWTILGGAWLPIWTGCVFVYWMVIYFRLMKKSDDIIEKITLGTVSCIGTYFDKDEDAYKESSILIWCAFIQSVIGLGVITIFGVSSFDCSTGICSDANTRQIFSNTENRRMLIFWALGVVSAAMDIILFLVMQKQDIFYPLYEFLKTEICTMMPADIPKEKFKELLNICPSYVTTTKKNKIFDSISGGPTFTREEYMKWVEPLTPDKLYRDILHA